MAASSITVILNSLRISGSRRNKKEETIMSKFTLLIPDMMCAHCEKRIREAVASLGGT
jgi:cation transport ATPase